MPGTPHAVEIKLEDAACALLVAAQNDIGIGVPIYAGARPESVNGTCVLVAVLESAPSGPGRGNWKCHLQVQVFSNIKLVTRAQHRDRVGAVQNVFCQADVMTALSGAAQDFTVTGEVTWERAGTDFQNGCWVHETRMNIICRGSTV